MELRNIKYFVELVNRGSFTAVAEHIGVTKSTARKIVASLEEQFGIPLFVRGNGRGVKLTEAGELVYIRGKELLAQSVQLEFEVARINDMVKALAVGISPDIHRSYFCAFENFRRNEPDINLSVEEMPCEELTQSISDRKINIGISAKIVDSEKLNKILLSRKSIYFVEKKSDKPRGAQPISLADVCRYKDLMVYTGETDVADVVALACYEDRLIADISVKSTDVDFIESLIDAGAGVAIVPDSIARAFEYGRYSITPIFHPKLLLDVYIVWRRGCELSPEAEKFIHSFLFWNESKFPSILRKRIA